MNKLYHFVWKDDGPHVEDARVTSTGYPSQEEAWKGFRADYPNAHVICAFTTDRELIEVFHLD